MKQNLRFGLDRVYEYRVVFITTYSVDSIKRTVLLKVLFKIFNEVIKKIKKVSIKCTIRLIESTEELDFYGPQY